jgi:hypothetical protein
MALDLKVVGGWCVVLGGWVECGPGTREPDLCHGAAAVSAFWSGPAQCCAQRCRSRRGTLATWGSSPAPRDARRSTRSLTPGPPGWTDLLRPPLVRLIGLRVWALPKKNGISRERGCTNDIHFRCVFFLLWSFWACVLNRRRRSKGAKQTHHTILYFNNVSGNFGLGWSSVMAVGTRMKNNMFLLYGSVSIRSPKPSPCRNAHPEPDAPTQSWRGSSRS